MPSICKRRDSGVTYVTKRRGSVINRSRQGSCISLDEGMGVTDAGMKRGSVDVLKQEDKNSSRHGSRELLELALAEFAFTNIKISELQPQVLDLTKYP